MKKCVLVLVLFLQFYGERMKLNNSALIGVMSAADVHVDIVVCYCGILQYFDDAYRSTLSCILVDNIERLLDYGPIGPRYSNLTLQALLVLLKKEPPKGRKLLILCTSSRRQVLEDMEMLSAFTAILHVPNLSKPEHLIAVLEESDAFSKDNISKIKKQISHKKVFIGIKKLLALIDMARQTDERDRVLKFVTKMQDEGCLSE